jgi:hypothetical protein
MKRSELRKIIKEEIYTYTENEPLNEQQSLPQMKEFEEFIKELKKDIDSEESKMTMYRSWDLDTAYTILERAEAALSRAKLNQNKEY